MTPPRLARWLVGRAARRDDRASIVGELDEEFARLVEHDGARVASRWYWRQVRRSVLPLVWLRLAGRSTAGGSNRPLRSVAWGEAAKWLVRHPRLGMVCIGTLGIATGAALAGATVVHRVVIRELPFPDAGRIVALWNTGPELTGGVRSISFQDLEDWRARSTSLDAVSGHLATTFTLTERGEPRKLDAARVGLDFDRVLAVAAAAGRLLQLDDFHAGSHPVAVLTDAFWRREFGASPAAVGQTLVLDGRPYRIVGVLPAMPTIVPPYAHDIWVPLIARPGVSWEHARGTTWLTGLARLKSGVSIDAARAELTAVAAALAAEYPTSNAKRVAMDLRPLRHELVGDATRALMLLGGGVAAVLLVAWANLTNLLLTHATARRQEFAVRLAMGADRRRIAEQLVAESLMLAGLGVAAGVALMPLLLRGFVALYPGTLPRAGELAAGPGILVAAACLVVVGALFLALPQARLVSRPRLISEVRHGARLTWSRGDRRIRAMLVAVQVAFCVVLLTCGTLFVRTLAALDAVDPGFRPDGVLTFSVSPSPARFGSAAATADFFRQALDSLRAIPQVHNVASATAVPFVSRGWNFPIERDPALGRERTLVAVSVVSPGYFTTLGMRVAEGRTFNAAEHRPGAAPVVMINDALASVLFPAESAVGRTMEYDGTRLIVGVVRGARRRLSEPATPELYMPWHNAGRALQRIILHAAGDPLPLLPAVASRIHAIDPTAPISSVERLSDVVDRSLGAPRFRAAILAALAGVAVLLAALGVYSVTAFAVAMQARENGIRRALGEAPHVAARRIVSRAVRPVAAGALAGAGSIVATGAAIQEFLFEVDARDPLLVAAICALVFGVALSASVGPARSAMRADPLACLRLD